MRIAVAGGTGLVGSLVVAQLSDAGHDVVVLARARGVDLVTGTGLAAALTGVEAVIDVSGRSTASRRRSLAFFGAVTENLLAAGERAGVAHHVALSIVGIDRVDFGYYAGKRRQEELLLSGNVPATILRATQFHEFASQVLERVRGPIAVVPQMRVQPIAAREVAAALVAAALAPPAGRAADLAGPREESLVDMSRRFVRARGQRRILLPIRLPGKVGRAMVGGGQLPIGPGPRGTQTFAEWLATAA